MMQCARKSAALLRSSQSVQSQNNLLSSIVSSKCQSGVLRALCSTVATPSGGVYKPRRAMLYVPGNDERKIQKIAKLDVDCAVLDCEDGVALNRKEEARHTIARVLNEIEFGRTEACVRVNSMCSGLVNDDLKVILQSPKLPETIMLPKVEDPSQLELFADCLDEALPSSVDLPNFRLVIFVESALGLLNLRDVCKKGVELSEMGVAFNLEGVVFGSDDYVADIGATRTKDALEVLMARQTVIATTKAFRLQAIDLVDINFKDLSSLRAQCEEGARMGFNGKQVIHPAQIPVVQQAFAPSAEKISWATELIQAFHQHQQEGKGAFTFRGHMIDMPLLKQAQNIVDLSQAISSSPAAEASQSTTESAAL